MEVRRIRELLERNSTGLRCVSGSAIPADGFAKVRTTWKLTRFLGTGQIDCLVHGPNRHSAKWRRQNHLGALGDLVSTAWARLCTSQAVHDALDPESSKCRAWGVTYPYGVDIHFVEFLLSGPCGSAFVFCRVCVCVCVGHGGGVSRRPAAREK